MSHFQTILFLLPGFIIAITFHEFAHAYSALLLGDGYPAKAGRLSLNPLRHLSAAGILAVFVIGLGWARPVESNPYNFKQPRVHFLMTSLAGPAANLVLLLFFALVIRAFPALDGMALYMIFYAAVINGVLMIINLLPIPPLDGSRIWLMLIPGKRLTEGRFSILWLLLLLAILRLDLLNGLFDFIINIVLAVSGLQ